MNICHFISLWGSKVLTFQRKGILVFYSSVKFAILFFNN